MEVSRFFLVAAAGIGAFELQSFIQGCVHVFLVLLVLYTKKTIDSWHSSHSTVFIHSLACGDEYDWDCETEVARLNS